jgi:hypothetical protein
MSFEYRDDTGARLTVATASTGISIWTKPEDVVVAHSRVEEVVAGIRDAARQASGQQPDTTHPGFDIAGYPENHAGPREKCPDPACETDQHANCGPECPAAGLDDAQPANEAHPPTTGYAVEVHSTDGWTQITAVFDTLAAARQQRTRLRAKVGTKPMRIIRETTTRTVEEDETR